MSDASKAPAPWDRVPPWLAALTLAALTVLAYLPALLHGGFIWDDPQYLLENPLISSRLSDLLAMWKPYTTPQYYPLVFSSLWIEHNLWGTDAAGGHAPMGYHITNLVLHIGSALLAWRVFKVLGVRWAWMIGAIFALHPMHVESAAWITERKNVLSAFFYLLAALAYLRFDDGYDVPGKRRPWRWYIVAMLCFVLALLGKTVTCSLPAALILALLFQRKQLSAGRLMPLAPMFVVGFAMAMITASIERHGVGAEAFDYEKTSPLVDRLLVASHAWLFYPTKLLLPSPLIFNYPRWEIDPHNAMQWLPVLVLLAIGVAVIVAWRRGCRGPFLGVSFYMGSILPAVGFVYVYPHKYSFVADHFCYLASLGVIALIVSGLARVVRQGAGAMSAAFAVLLACGTLTYLQCGDYRNEPFLWQSTLARHPGSWMAHKNLAGLYFQDADALLKRDYEAAAKPWLEMSAEHCRKALELDPLHYKALINLGEAEHYLGHHTEAAKAYEDGLKIILDGYAGQPEKLELFPFNLYCNHLAQDLGAIGETEKAEAMFQRALQHNHRDPFVLLRYGLFLRQQGKDVEAEGNLSQVIRLLPTQQMVRLPGAKPPPPNGPDIIAAFRVAMDLLETKLQGAALYEQTARLHVARFHLIASQKEAHDLRTARLLVEGVMADVGDQFPEVPALMAVVQSEAGRKADAKAILQVAGEKNATNVAEIRKAISASRW